MMLGHGFAGLAVDAIQVEVIAEPFKARRIIWELLLEVFEGVGQHLGFAIVVQHDWLPTRRVN